MRVGDLIEISPRLQSHAGRVVRVVDTEVEWDENGQRVLWLVYDDPDGNKNELGEVLQWRIRDHLAIRARYQRPDYAEQDRQTRESDPVRQRTDEALRQSLQGLGMGKRTRRRARR